MPSVRIAAAVALGLTMVLFLLWFVPREAEYADRLLGLAALLIAGMNACAVLRLARIREGLRGVALWLVLAAVSAAIAIGTIGDWAPFVVANDGSFVGIIAYVAIAGWILVALFWSGLVALAMGWGLWFASRTRTA